MKARVHGLGAKKILKKLKMVFISINVLNNIITNNQEMSYKNF